MARHRMCSSFFLKKLAGSLNNRPKLLCGLRCDHSRRETIPRWNIPVGQGILKFRALLYVWGLQYWELSHGMVSFDL